MLHSSPRGSGAMGARPYTTPDLLKWGYGKGRRLPIFARSFILRNRFAIDPISKGLSGRVTTSTLFARIAAKIESRFFSA